MSIETYRVLLAVSLTANMLLFALFRGALDSRKFWMGRTHGLIRKMIGTPAGTEGEKK